MNTPASIGPYQVVRKIATGGMAEIFLCRQSGPGGFEKPVVIKRIHDHLAGDSDFVSMFISEAKVAADLHHANIVDVIDFGEKQGSYFIAMEYVDGPNLKVLTRRAFERQVLVPFHLCVHVLEQVAGGLDFAHRKRGADGRPLGIVHRDVSPQNILLSSSGEVKLTDFGIAKVASRAQGSKAGTLKGKIAYMSPEQSYGREIDARSDVFALGVVGFEIVTGLRLFQGRSDVATLENVRAARVPPPRALDPAVPEELEAILLRALAREPDDRYPSAREFQQELTGLLSRLGCPHPAADLADFVSGLCGEVEEPALYRRWGRTVPGAPAEEPDPVCLPGSEAGPGPDRPAAGRRRRLVAAAAAVGGGLLIAGMLLGLWLAGAL